MEELNKEEMLGTEGGACWGAGGSDNYFVIRSLRKGEMILTIGENVDLNSIEVDFFKNRKRNESSNWKGI